MYYNFTTELGRMIEEILLKESAKKSQLHSVAGARYV